MISKKESVEDYLEKILMLQKEHDVVRAIDIARFMNFSKPSVSIALKKLVSYGYVDVDQSSGAVTLTKEGKKIAEETYEKHRILSQTFINLGVPEDIAYHDACLVEHVISKETFDAIKKHYEKGEH